MSSLYHSLIFDPLYNGLIGLISIFPWMDAGVAVIIFTIFVKLILFPLSKKAIITQVRMKDLQPELNKIKELYKDNKQEQGLKTMALYREKGMNPFSSIFLLLIQLPILYALYAVFVQSGLPAINEGLLYSFVSVPTINMQFFGLLDISKASVFLSLIAAASQFLQLHYSLALVPAKNPTNKKPSAQPDMSDIAQNMTRQMKYIFPVMVFFISYKISAVIALYWAVSSLFTLGQELYVRHRLATKQAIV